jgi:protein-S-isoprenylcysteine O-methyltransferase Ste14
MQSFFAVLTLILVLGMVISRVILLRRRGIGAIAFGKIDKTDYLILPFALFYFYLIVTNAFGLPTTSKQAIFHSEVISWIGVLFCIVGLVVLLWSLISLGQSFRIGIDLEHPNKLVTGGVFAYSRNPIYVAFASILFGQFLIFSNWILLVYPGAAIWLFHRQVLREEEYLKNKYGGEYDDYYSRVRRYF